VARERRPAADLVGDAVTDEHSSAARSIQPIRSGVNPGSRNNGTAVSGENDPSSELLACVWGLGTVVIHAGGVPDR